MSGTDAHVSFGGATVCGIAGIYARSGRHASPELLLAMVPARVHFLDELPKTASGKIRKKGLQEPAAAGSPAAEA